MKDIFVNISFIKKNFFLKSVDSIDSESVASNTLFVVAPSRLEPSAGKLLKNIFTDSDRKCWSSDTLRMTISLKKRQPIIFVTAQTEILRDSDVTDTAVRCAAHLKVWPTCEFC